jgi:hypothetical protein
MTAFTIAAAAEYINAALCAVSKEETRYYLKGVFFDARGFIAATNGHIAFAAHCPQATYLADIAPALPGSLPGLIVPDAPLRQAIKAAGRGKPLDLMIERDTLGQWFIQYGAARVHFTPVDGSFPDWTRVIPEAPETETAAHYQPQYVAAIGNMAAALRDGKKGNASLFHIHQSGESPALVTFPRKVDKSTDTAGPRGDCCAVMMPMRAHNAGGFDRNVFLKG